MIDGRSVPVFPAAQWARVPREWLAARRSAAGTCNPRQRAAHPGG